MSFVLSCNMKMFILHLKRIWCIVLGEFAPVGPTSFQFDVPENAPITISPLVGTVEPGAVCIVFRMFYYSIIRTCKF